MKEKQKTRKNEFNLEDLFHDSVFEDLKKSCDISNFVEIVPIISHAFYAWKDAQSEDTKNWIAIANFRAKAGEVCVLPDAKGGIKFILLGLSDKDDFLSFGALPKKLKEGTYKINFKTIEPTGVTVSAEYVQKAVLAWFLGIYKFDKYISDSFLLNGQNCDNLHLIIPDSVDEKHLLNVLKATFLVRDLINEPAECIHPASFEDIIVDLIGQLGSVSVKSVKGDDLIAEYPLVHAVGRAGHYEPRVVEFEWGCPSNVEGVILPKIAIIGKGVCFDSGGLHLKQEKSMEEMKKDMAGAAHALGLASMIIQEKLPVRIHVLIPLVENMISSNSFKPGDIFTSRSGKTVEIISPDAEGRLLLADCITRTCELNPDLVIDFASLTGAATVALGSDVTAWFTNNDAVAADLDRSFHLEGEYGWRLPLHAPYRKKLDSGIADIASCGSDRYGGAITATLFLVDFLKDNVPFIHFDIHASNSKSSPGKPKGGEAMGMRSMFRYIKNKYQSAQSAENKS